jgi:condensin complex subunit 2
MSFSLVFVSLLFACETIQKINQKNTWSLKLIDYIDDVIAHQEQQNSDSVVGTNFQVVSCTLDASVKIYSHRVDSVHTAAYQMLGGLARAEDKSEEDNRMVDSSNKEKNEDEESDKKLNKEESEVSKLGRKVHNFIPLFLFSFVQLFIQKNLSNK